MRLRELIPLQEIFDQSYDFKYEAPRKFDRQDKHEYHFSSPHDDYKASIYHDFPQAKKEGHAEVEFTGKKGFLGKSNAEGKDAHKVFSTIHKIMKHHLTTHPEVGGYHFSASTGYKNHTKGGSWEEEGSRAKLYDHMARKFAHKHTTHDLYGDGSEKGYNIDREDVK